MSMKSAHADLGSATTSGNEGLAPTLTLDSPFGVVADHALRTAQLARGLARNSGQSLVGRRSFWRTGPDLDAYVGQLAALRAPVSTGGRTRRGPPAPAHPGGPVLRSRQQPCPTVCRTLRHHWTGHHRGCPLPQPERRTGPTGGRTGRGLPALAHPGVRSPDQDGGRGRKGVGRGEDCWHLRTPGVRSGVRSSGRDGRGREDVDCTDGGRDLEQVLAGPDHPQGGDVRTLESAAATSQTPGVPATGAVLGQLADPQGRLGDGNQAAVAAHFDERASCSRRAAVRTRFQSSAATSSAVRRTQAASRDPGSTSQDRVPPMAGPTSSCMAENAPEASETPPYGCGVYQAGATSQRRRPGQYRERDQGKLEETGQRDRDHHRGSPGGRRPDWPCPAWPAPSARSRPRRSPPWPEGGLAVLPRCWPGLGQTAQDAACGGFVPRGAGCSSGGLGGG